jgi:hypothetical protein
MTVTADLLRTLHIAREGDQSAVGACLGFRTGVSGMTLHAVFCKRCVCSGKAPLHFPVAVQAAGIGRLRNRQQTGEQDQ